MTFEQLIRAALPEVVTLFDRAFATVGHAPQDGAEAVEYYLAHGSHALALEHLIYMADGADHFGFRLSAHTYDLIVQAGERWKMDAPQGSRIDALDDFLGRSSSEAGD